MSLTNRGLGEHFKRKKWGNGKHRDEGEDEAEGVGRVLTTLELSARIVYILKQAIETKKEIEDKRRELQSKCESE